MKKLPLKPFIKMDIKKVKKFRQISKAKLNLDNFMKLLRLFR